MAKQVREVVGEKEVNFAADGSSRPHVSNVVGKGKDPLTR